MVAPGTAAGLTGSVGFGWFVTHAPPTSWQQAGLPGSSSVLHFPPTAHPIEADRGAVAVAQLGAHGDFQLYLNATPQQGGESLTNWAAFRLAHQADESSLVRVDATAAGLSFTDGGRGSCVMDDYLTRVGSRHYREIACLVRGRHGSSVIVAAAGASDWGTEQATLHQAVEAYAVH